VTVGERPIPALAVLVAAGALAASLAVAAGAPVALRAPLALAFALLGPGAALVPLLRLGDPVGVLALVIALSLALDVTVGLVMVYAGLYSPVGGFLVLAALALAGASAQVLTSERAES
jgi:hypothetical protein